MERQPSCDAHLPRLDGGPPRPSDEHRKRCDDPFSEVERHRECAEDPEDDGEREPGEVLDGDQIRFELVTPLKPLQPEPDANVDRADSEGERSLPVVRNC